MNKVICDDCLNAMKQMPDNSVDAIITDPPYGLSFMGKKWDYDVPSQEIWEEALRVLKPGGYLLAFAGTRTQHRMAVRIEDAGFEIRDMIAWVYGSGFPKSLNIGKAVDKLQGNEREIVGQSRNGSNSLMGGLSNKETTTIQDITKGTSEWEGWGTALKPALEPITVARKPLEGTISQNCLKWGVGGINIDGCRVETSDKYSYPNGAGGNSFSVGEEPDGKRTEPVESNNLGRFPANLIHDGSDEVVGLFPQTGKSSGGRIGNKGSALNMMGNTYEAGNPGFGDSGSAARFFYCAKASKSERNRGCEELEEKAITEAKGNGLGRVCNICGTSQLKPCKCENNTWILPSNNKNNHPTVKPIALMEYLVKLVSPENSIVLDPFAGSGSTLIACKNLGRQYIGIEMNPEYVEIINARLSYEPPIKKELQMRLV
jgi:DNA modification methylase